MKNERTINPVSDTDFSPGAGEPGVVHVGGLAFERRVVFDADRGGADPGDGAGALPRAIGNWRRAYALVIGVLAADVVLLWLLGQVYG